MESKQITGKVVFNNFIWRFLERCGAQGVGFIVSIVLARLLIPSLYGTIAIVTVFLTILQVFVDSGLGNALIQKKDADDTDFSTVFYFNIVACIALYILLFFLAPVIASFYKNPELTLIIRVMGVALIISGVKNIQQSYVSKNMMFKKFFFATLIGTIGAGILGIFMAYHGFGVWALIAQYIFNLIVDTLILWITVRWRPKRLFSFGRLKRLFSYGWKLLVSSLIDTVYGDIRQLIIGKLYTSANLAFYNKGKTFPNVIIQNVNASINSVAFPSMSAVQDDKERLKDMTRRAMKVSTYVMAPFLMGLAFCCEPIIRLLLTEKWLPAVFFMRIFCITFLFYPVHTANLNAIKAIGRSDTFLKLEIIKKIVGLTALGATMFISVEAMAWSLLFTSVASQIINSWPNKKYLNYGYLEQLKDILPGILLAVFMGACVFPIQFIGLADIITLVIQIPLGALIFILLSKLFKMDSFNYLLGIIKPYIAKIWRRKKS